MNTKHTPRHIDLYTDGKLRWRIETDRDVDKAAFLYKAAPDLVEAARLLLDSQCGTIEEINDAVANLSRVVDKAEGEGTT